jgi:plasmid stability protein
LSNNLPIRCAIHHEATEEKDQDILHGQPVRLRYREWDICN